MPLIPFASHFLAGSLISLLMPVCLLIALVAWYVLSVKRVPSGRAERSKPERRQGAGEPPAGPGGAQGGPSGGTP